MSLTFRKIVLASSNNSDRNITCWLLLCCAMIFVMALLGAITRLTQSGLSITDWNPIFGVLPPLDANSWNKAFLDYQKIPQYKILNQGMTLADFKSIYFWEWLHRLWGRLIGTVYAGPFLYFLIKRKINRQLFSRLVLILGLGFLQGAIGWFMVSSGLEIRTSVSPFRLALHLTFALIIYVLLFWTALERVRLPVFDLKSTKQKIIIHGYITTIILATTIIWGALVAGLHAGEIYNTWPLMEGDFIPDAAFTLLPKEKNIFENMAMVQFIHRWLGPLTMLMIFSLCIRLWSHMPKQQNSKFIIGLGLLSLIQVLLGMSTLLSHVNIALATLHQAGAISLLSYLILTMRIISKR